jgi:hypothetical protein
MIFSNKGIRDQFMPRLYKLHQLLLLVTFVSLGSEELLAALPQANGVINSLAATAKGSETVGWQSIGGTPFGCDGPIRTTISYHQNIIFIAGSFTVCGDHIVNNIAAYDFANDQIIPLKEGDSIGLDGDIHALAKSQNILYVGGNFTSRSVSTAKNIISWDGNSWSSLGHLPSEQLDGPVYALEVFDGDVIAGGQFTYAGSSLVNSIARWSGKSWHPFLDGQSVGVDGSVFALSAHEQALYVGGYFSSAGTVFSRSIAKWTEGGWEPVGSTSNPGVGRGQTDLGEVHSIAAKDSAVYVGGIFDQAGSKLAQGLALWNGEDWHVEDYRLFTAINSGGSILFVPGQVYDLLFLGEDLVVSGAFNTTPSIQANNIAIWSDDEWQSVGDSDSNGVNDLVYSLLPINDQLVVSGVIRSAGGLPVSNIAIWNSGLWQRLSNINGGTNGEIFAALHHEENLYVGGDFTHIGGIDANGIARWDGAQWNTLGEDSENGVSGFVRALEIFQGELHLAGEFNYAGTVQANNIVRWDGVSWHALGGGKENGLTAEQNAHERIPVPPPLPPDPPPPCLPGSPCTPSVQDMLTTQEGLFVAGTFIKAGSSVANNIALWDGNNWHSLGDGIDAQSAVVRSMVYFDDSLYIGGQFGTAGGSSATNLAQWTGADWQAIGDSDDTVIKGHINAVTQFNGQLVVGGSFDSISGTTVNNLSIWNGKSWQPIGATGPLNGVDGEVHVLLVEGATLVVGGSFTSAGAVNANNIAIWSDKRWNSLGEVPSNGVIGSVFAVDVWVQSLAVGGGFYYAGDLVSKNFAFFADRQFDQIFYNGFEPTTLSRSLPPPARRIRVLDGSAEPEQTSVESQIRLYCTSGGFGNVLSA